MNAVIVRDQTISNPVVYRIKYCVDNSGYSRINSAFTLEYDNETQRNHDYNRLKRDNDYFAELVK
jgi:hypothetical protein